LHLWFELDGRGISRASISGVLCSSLAMSEMIGQANFEFKLLCTDMAVEHLLLRLAG